MTSTKGGRAAIISASKRKLCKHQISSAFLFLSKHSLGLQLLLIKPWTEQGCIQAMQLASMKHVAHSILLALAQVKVKRTVVALVPHACPIFFSILTQPSITPDCWWQPN